MVLHRDEPDLLLPFLVALKQKGYHTLSVREGFCGPCDDEKGGENEVDDDEAGDEEDTDDDDDEAG